MNKFLTKFHRQLILLRWRLSVNANSALIAIPPAVIILSIVAFSFSKTYLFNQLKEKIEKRISSPIEISELNLSWGELQAKNIVIINHNIRVNEVFASVNTNPFSDKFLKINKMTIASQRIFLSTEKINQFIRNFNSKNGTKSNKSIGIDNFFHNDSKVSIKTPKISISKDQETLPIFSFVGSHFEVNPLKRIIHYKIQKTLDEFKTAEENVFGSIKLNHGKLSIKAKSKNKQWKLIFTAKKQKNKYLITLNTNGLPNYLSNFIPSQISNKKNIKFNFQTLVSNSKNKSIYKFKGNFKLRNISINHKLLSKIEVGHFNPSISFQGHYNKSSNFLNIKRSKLTLSDPSKQTLSIAKASFSLNGYINKDSVWRGQISIPKTSCQTFINVAPKNLIPNIKDFVLSGSLALKAKFRFDTKQYDNFYFKKETSYFSCKTVYAPSTYTASTLMNPFNFTRHTPRGREIFLTTNPNSPTYTPLKQISSSILKVFVASEDAGFWFHKGFDFNALEIALRKNLSENRVAAGGSTITMQTIKNLFLSPKRTISRKLQEIFLAWHVERTISKDRILEIYLNIIEFGPGIYGITNAAQHFFNKKPIQLNLKEAAYLASILPSPIKRYKNFCYGKLPDSYNSIIDIKLNQIHAQGRINFNEFLSARNIPLIFNSQSRYSTTECLEKIAFSNFQSNQFGL